MNRQAVILATTILFVYLVLLCATSAYCEAIKNTEALTARIKALLELEGKPFFDERDKLIEEWSADVAMLEELQGQLPPIAKAVAGGLIARIRFPDLMKDLDEKHYIALCTIADPPVIKRDITGERFPPPYPLSNYRVEGSSVLKKMIEDLSFVKNIKEADEYRKYYSNITLPNNNATLPFMFEVLAMGTRFDIDNDALWQLYKQYGDIAQVLAMQSGLEFTQRNDPIVTRLIFAVCSETKSLESPCFFARVTEHALKRHLTDFYHLLAQEKYQEMVRRTKILGDPDSKIPPLPKDALYYRYFEEIVKYVEDNPQPTATPIPTLIPSPSPTQKLDQAEPQNKSGEVQKGSAWFVILALAVAFIILIALMMLILRQVRR